MVRHIVMWKFKEGTQRERDEFLTRLAGLRGVVPQIRSQEIGVDAAGGENYDAVLVADFDTMEDLAAYKTDPRHVEVSKLCKAIRVSRVAVDYIL